VRTFSVAATGSRPARFFVSPGSSFSNRPANSLAPHLPVCSNALQGQSSSAWPLSAPALPPRLAAPPRQRARSMASRKQPHIRLEVERLETRDLPASFLLGGGRA